MNIIVHSKTLPVTQAMREFIAKQATKLGKFSQPVQSLQIFLEDRKKHDGMALESKVNIRIQVPGKDIVTSSSSTNLYKAVHDAMEDGARWLRKRKEKFTTKRALKRRARVIERSPMAMT